MKSEGLVTTVAQIRDNLRTMARYALGAADEQEFHRGRIKNGKNFIAKMAATEWTFAPSKFVGYATNNTSHMRKLDNRDGGITNRRLTRLLGPPLERGGPGYAEVDAAYLDYVASHGFEASRHQQGRKYWLLG